MIKRLLIMVCILLVLASVPVMAADTYNGYPFPADIDVNGFFIKCAEKPILIEGTTYIPLRAFSDAIGGTTSWNQAEQAATLAKGGHNFTFYPHRGECSVDGVKRSYSSMFYKGHTFIPVRAVSEFLGYNVSWDDTYLTVKITAPGVNVPESAVDRSYTYDDLMYLGKIVQIESGYQHFDVKLGVAATVMNRVRSSEFPNDIKGVIYDKRYGTQFPPAHTEKFASLTPSRESMIAAKCVLNGVNLVRNSQYFVDVPYAPSSWVHNNRPHYITLHDMAFYE